MQEPNQDTNYLSSTDTFIYVWSLSEYVWFMSLEQGQGQNECESQCQGQGIGQVKVQISC